MNIKHDMFGSSGANDQTQENSIKPTLKSLIELGCVKRDVHIGDLRFVLRSLNAQEALAAKKFLDKDDLDDDDKLFQFREFVLAIGIESVNGEPLENFYQEDSRMKVLDRRRKVLSNMQPSVLDKLMTEFNELSQEANPDIDPDIVKN